MNQPKPKATTPTQADDAASDIAGLMALAQQMGLLGGAAGGTDNPYAGQVWLGRGGDPRKDNSEQGSAPSSSPSASNLELALTLPYRWRDYSNTANKKQMERLVRAVQDATGQPVSDFETALEVWKKAVDAAANTWQATLGGKKGRPTTPWDELAKAARDRKAGVVNSLAGNNPAKKTVHKSITDLSDGDAWQVINETVTSLLGRAANDDEVREFAHRANQIAASNPTVTTTMTDSAGNQTSKSSGGFSSGDLELAAREQAFDDPEAGAFQAAGTYYNAFVDALSSMV